MPAASYTRDVLRSAILDELQDPNGVYFTSTLLNRLINNAMEQWCLDTKLRIKNTAISIVANQDVYDLTTVTPRVIEVLRVSCPTGASATDDYVLRPMTQTDLDQEYPNWRSDAAYWPFAYVRDLEGPQLLKLYPTPDSSQAATVRTGTMFASQNTGVLINIVGLTSTQATAATGGIVGANFLVGSLQVYYVAGSTDISSDATTVETACGISPDFQEALVWYVAARCCELDVSIAQQAKAQGYWAKWQDTEQRAIARGRSGMQVRPTQNTRGYRY